MESDINMDNIRKSCNNETIPRLIRLFRDHNIILYNIAKDKNNSKNNFYYILDWLEGIDSALRQKPKELLKEERLNTELYIHEMNKDGKIDQKIYSELQEYLVILNKYI